MYQNSTKLAYFIPLIYWVGIHAVPVSPAVLHVNLFSLDVYTLTCVSNGSESKHHEEEYDFVMSILKKQSLVVIVSCCNYHGGLKLSLHQPWLHKSVRVFEFSAAAAL